MTIRDFYDFLIIIIRDFLMIIRFPYSSRLFGLLHFQKPSHGTVDHLGDGSLSPGYIAACESRLLPAKLRFICNNSLVFHGCFDPPSSGEHSGPVRKQHFSARGSGSNHHAKSDCILHPDHESLLPWSWIYSPPRDAIIDSNLN